MNNATGQACARRSLYGILLSVGLHAALLLGIGQTLRAVAPRPNSANVHAVVPLQVRLLSRHIQAVATIHVASGKRSDLPASVLPSKRTVLQDAPKTMDAVTRPEPVAPMPSLSPVIENFTQSAPAHPRILASENQTPLAPIQSARPDYAYNPAPEYPMILREHGVGGTVWLRVRVDSEGRPFEVKLAKGSGYRLFDEAALRVVARWRFIPAQAGEQKFASWVEFPVRFTLNG